MAYTNRAILLSITMYLSQFKIFKNTILISIVIYIMEIKFLMYVIRTYVFLK